MSDTPNARHNDSTMLALIQTIQDDVKAIQVTLDARIQTEPKEWAKALSDMMTKAFPQGDPEGHKRFHEAAIRAADDKAAFWHEMRKSVMKWGIFGFALWALKTLIEAAAMWIQHGATLK